MADKKISELVKFTPIQDGIRIPCSVMVGDKLQSRVIVTEDFGKYVSPYVLDQIKSGRGVSVKPGTTAGTIEIDLDVDTSLYKIVSELPTTGIETNKIYLVPSINAEDPEDNKYIEYGYIDNKWEKLGEHKATTDLSEYATVAYVNSKIDTITGGSGELSLSSLTNKISEVETKATTNASNISSLTDDVNVIKNAGYITEDDIDLSPYATKTELNDYVKTENLKVPTKVSELTNDSKYVVESTLKTELDKKVDAIEGKVLSSNDFTNDEKTKLASLENYDDTELAGKVAALEAIDHSQYLTDHQDISGKVDKIEGKGLSTEDFTTELKTKLTGIETGAQKNTVSSVNGRTGAITGLVEESELTDKVNAILNTKGYLTEAPDISGKADQTDLDAALDTITKLENRIKALEDKLKFYDTRFGYVEPVDGKVEWTKSFLLIDEE